MPYRFAALFLVLIACAGAPAPVPAPTPAPAPKETMVECLVRQDAHLYGASWCGPCHEQLALFGNDARLVPYTDCDPTGLLDFKPECKFLGESPEFPLWTFSNNSRLIGVRHPAVIAAVAGCPYP